MNKGGTYSDNKTKFTTEELNKLNDEIIKKHQWKIEKKKMMKNRINKRRL